MKRYRFFLSVLVGVFLWNAFLTDTAEAANRYVRQGAGGTGADWTNAYSALPSDLTRGDTYYIADGSYSGYTFDDAGTAVITIKKATIADHGTETGWNSTYGDGQAVFAGDFTFVTNYYTIDGQTRNESSWSTKSAYGISIPGVYENSFNTAVGDNITLRYLDIGPDDGTTNIEGYGGAVLYFGGFSDIAQNWVVERNYIHNGRAMVQHAGVHNMLYQYNWFAKNWEKTCIRGQIRASSVVIRYNVFKNTCQGNSFDPTATSCTSITGWYGNAGSTNEDFSNSKVYGNLFWDTIGTVPYTDALIWMGDDRTSQGGGPQNCANCAIFNNTFVGMGKMYGASDYGDCGLDFSGIKANSEARNNIWYDVSSRCTTGCSAEICSNNNNIGTSSSVFVNAAGGNFRLSSDGATGGGFTLTSPYNTDMDGNIRGSGVWDIGAYEYVSGTPLDPDTTPPTSPTSLAATAPSQSSISVSWTASTDPTVAGQTTSGVSNYIIERCQGTGCSTFTQVGTPTNSPFVDTGLTPGTFYNYHVRARDGAGNLSGWSNVVGATTQAPDTQAPTAPSNLQASVVSSSAINLTWTASTDNVGVTGYKVERCSGSSCTAFTQIATPTATNYSDTGLSASTTYRYQVRATDAANNNSAYSTIASATTPETPPISDSLMLGMNFNEGTGTTTSDVSGHNNTGTLSNTTWTTSGKYGNALTFNGTSSIVSVSDSNSLDLTTGMTLSAWVYPTNLSSSINTVLAKTNGASVSYDLIANDDTNVPQIYMGGTTYLRGTSQLPLNAWTHLASTFDGSMLRLFVNGTQVSSSNWNGPISVGTGILTLGNSPWNEYFQGRLDDVRIYNMALTQSEIQTDMNTPLTSGGSGTPIVCNTVTPSNFSQAAYNSYGAPYDLFASNAQLVDAKCTSADTHTISATIGKANDTTRIVYIKGYYFDPGVNNWAQYTGTCTGTLNGEWCAGPVTATITDPDLSTASAGAPAYFVGMVCSVQGGGWKCGCRDTNCTNFYWMIQGAGQ